MKKNSINKKPVLIVHAPSRAVTSNPTNLPVHRSLNTVNIANWTYLSLATLLISRTASQEPSPVPSAIDPSPTKTTSFIWSHARDTRKKRNPAPTKNIFRSRDESSNRVNQARILETNPEPLSTIKETLENWKIPGTWRIGRKKSTRLSFRKGKGLKALSWSRTCHQIDRKSKSKTKDITGSNRKDKNQECIISQSILLHLPSTIRGKKILDLLVKYIPINRLLILRFHLTSASLQAAAKRSRLSAIKTCFPTIMERLPWKTQSLSNGLMRFPKEKKRWCAKRSPGSKSQLGNTTLTLYQRTSTELVFLSRSSGWSTNPRSLSLETTKGF